MIFEAIIRIIMSLLTIEEAVRMDIPSKHFFVMSKICLPFLSFFIRFIFHSFLVHDLHLLLDHVVFSIDHHLLHHKPLERLSFVASLHGIDFDS